MAELGGMLSAAVVKMIGDKIGSAIVDRVMMQWHLKDDLEDMEMALEFVMALLEDAEARSIKSKAVRLWLKRLKFAAYDISDMFDEFEADLFTKQAAAKVLCCLPSKILIIQFYDFYAAKQDLLFLIYTYFMIHYLKK
jgi:hypothetical protein